MRHLPMLGYAMAVVPFMTASHLALAFVAPGIQVSGLPEGMQVLRPNLVEEHGAQAKLWSDDATIHRDSVNGATRLINGKLGEFKADVSKTSVALKDLLASADAFMNKHAKHFSGRGLSYTLNTDATHVSDEDQFLSFDVFLKGEQIIDAHVDFRFKFGELVQVQNYSFNDAVSVDAKNFSHADLAQKLSRIVNTEPKFVRNVVRIIVDGHDYTQQRMAEFLYDVDGVPYLAQISYLTGEVFQNMSTHYYASGTATTTVYNRSWVDNETAEVPLAWLAIKVATGAVRSGVDGVFNFTGNTVPSINGFGGDRVRANVSTGTLVKLVAAKNEGSDDQYTLKFTPKPNADPKADKDMAQSMIYAHVNRIVDRASEFINPAWFKAQLTANANINRTCNAFWNGSTINFFSAGSNCANTALSADIIYHEWGHGLDAKTGGIADSAFSEGFGDIMSLVMTGSPDLGIGFRANGNGIRELRTDKVYPRDRGEVHYEGLIIGSTFYDVYEALIAQYGELEARNTLARYAFKVILTARRYTDVYNALLVIDDDDANLSNMTPNLCLLNKAFNAHGLASKDARCASDI